MDETSGSEQWKVKMLTAEGMAAAPPIPWNPHNTARERPSVIDVNKRKQL